MRKPRQTNNSGRLSKIGVFFGCNGRCGPISVALAAALVMISLTVPAAQAADEDRFSLSLGIFLTDRDSETRLDGSSGMPGSDVDLENDLGLDSFDSVFRVDGYFRFNKKHRFDFSAFNLSRAASTQIQKDIDWNDTLFPVDAVIESNFDLTIYKAAYTWSFLQREKGYIGITAGLYIADFRNSLLAPSLGEREISDSTAPLPVLGLRGEYHLSEKWSFRASGEVFAFEYDDYDGQLFDAYAGLDYQIFRHMAIGVGINSVRFNIGIAKENINGKLDWQYIGGLVFFKFDF